ncbi:PREDICTED: scarecrow-like protein 14 [Tarenaya hassleriana]|uniref:scarecrow-like protein 14 n=1 Tax=Tarenaya hassleriana TaxID=28532 RepID=UPI00053C7B70|nr:PREDICTED: scarecrow-like protein 14 [Tarenaya hassleriana]
MGSYSPGYPGSLDGFDFNNQIDLPGSNETLGVGNGFYLDDPLLDLASLDVPSAPPTTNFQNPGTGSSSPSDDSDFSDSVLKYISQVLMEEDMQEKPCMFHDALALQAAERSLYEALGEDYPSSLDQQQPPCPNQPADSPHGSWSGGSSDHGASSTTTSSDSHWSFDGSDQRPSWLQTPVPSNYVFQSTSRSSPQSTTSFSNNLAGGDNNGIFGSGFSGDLVSSMFNESELVMQFKKGVEEASKFLPKSSQLVIDVENYIPSSGFKENDHKVFVKKEKDEREDSSSSYRLNGKKSHGREDEDLVEERSNKQSAVYVEESELSEMFDKVLLCGGGNGQPLCILNQTFSNDSGKESSNKSSKGETMQQNVQVNGTKARGKKQGGSSGSNSKKETADLRTLLVLCAQAVSVDDRRTANELLRQIRQHSSPLGVGSERMAHYFANSLEARLAGTGTQIYTTLSSKKTSAADMLKAYQKYISVCPFKKIAIIFANHSILHLAGDAKTIHIIDFGISYGFQWPSFIHRLSWRPGGPPKLRITGIELPQRGFRPAEGVQETGHRLARYCQRYNVPFEYTAIAQKWETIKVEDLKINQGEFVAVNSLFRFRNLLDETVVVNSPRDAVFKLVRKVKPNIFIPAILSGSYNAPFFVTRFREAMFHYSALFDMCDTNLSREDEMRLMFEKEFYGREIMNVVACEGTERVERPETYKQWQARAIRAGFRQLPLEKELIDKLKLKVETGYDKDFDVDQDGHWLLQGWKGRIVYASSAWAPA